MKILKTPEIIAGKALLNEINNLLKNLNANIVMVITDKGIVNAGIYNKLQEILVQANIKIVLFDEVQPDPEIKLVKNVVDIARKNRIEAVIGIGGGSSLDTAKVVAALINNDKDSIWNRLCIP